MSLLKHELPYSADSAKLFARIAHQPWAVYLDSGQPASQYGRYDILAAAPFMTLTTDSLITEIQGHEGSRSSSENPFILLKQALEPYAVQACELPFCGGAIGYFGYDLARRLEHLLTHAEDGEHMPQMMIGIYDWVVLVDHRVQRAWLVSHGLDAKTREQWSTLCQLFEQPATTTGGTFRVTSPITSNMDLPFYSKAFDKIKHYIHEGDCYQVNLSQRFAAQAEGDPWAAYLHLRSISPAPFLAYMNFPEAQVLSASPERFIQVMGSHVETRPIKGTRPRSENPEQDRANAEELRNSLKDRAENLMIVDLLRNDISKSCALGSVQTKRLFSLESFANVHHLVSTVTGTLASGKSALDILRDCFPGGSVTGAPKLRAMQIIEELEPHRRGVYCGAIGYIGFDGNMDTNIAIRTAVYSAGEFRFWAGGGIVADSEMRKEYSETLDKASSMLELMQYFGARLLDEGDVTNVGS